MMIAAESLLSQYILCGGDCLGKDSGGRSFLRRWLSRVVTPSVSKDGLLDVSIPHVVEQSDHIFFVDGGGVQAG